MGTIYQEFDTTYQTLIPDLLAKILTSTDWARVSNASALFTTSGAMSVGATSVPHASGAAAAAGIVVGSVIRLGAEGAADAEYKLVTAASATSLTISASIFAHPSGSNVYLGNTVVKATTAAGAEMICDLSPTLASSASYLQFGHYQSYASGVIGASVLRFVHWRSSGGLRSDPIHVIVSAGKEHLYVSIEGPRPGEANPVNATYGSVRTYMFLSSLTPYHDSDVLPVVVSGGGASSSLAADLTNNSHLVAVSRNYANTASWVTARQVSLYFPLVGNSQTSWSFNTQRQTEADGAYYLAPYVVFEDLSGLRGRLSSFFYAGITHTDYQSAVQPPPLGAIVTVDSKPYKLLAVGKGDGQTSQYSWEQFGATANMSVSPFGSPVVAVPTVAA